MKCWGVHHRLSQSSQHRIAFNSDERHEHRRRIGLLLDQGTEKCHFGTSTEQVYTEQVPRVLYRQTLNPD